MSSLRLKGRNLKQLIGKAWVASWSGAMTIDHKQIESRSIDLHYAIKQGHKKHIG